MERKKFQRVIRDKHLTEAEVASDEQIRNQVKKEFPPAELAALETGGAAMHCVERFRRVPSRCTKSAKKRAYRRSLFLDLFLVSVTFAWPPQIAWRKPLGSK